MTAIRTILLLFALVVTAAAQQSTVFKRNVFLNATTAQASGPLPNIGQAVHIVTLQFPTAVADVTGFVIRFEASFDNTTFFPISEDITSAKYNGSSFAYSVQRCNGVYPYVRLRIVTPAAIAVTAHYTGSIQPIGIVRLSGDRYIIASPLQGATVTGICTNIDNNCYIDGQRVVPVVPSEWTSVNLNSDVRTDGDGFVTLYRANGNANGYSMVCRSLPGPQFDVIMTMDRDQQIYGGDSVSPAAFIVRESSSGKFVAYVFQGGGAGHVFSRERWNSPTSFNSGTNPASVTPMRLLQFRITQGATTRSYSVPNRAGTVWSKLSNFGQADGNNDFFTTAPDQLCFGVLGNNPNYATLATFVGFEVL